MEIEREEISVYDVTGRYVTDYSYYPTWQPRGLIDFWNKAKYSAFTASKYVPIFKYILYALIYKSWNFSWFNPVWYVF